MAGRRNLVVNPELASSRGSLWISGRICFGLTGVSMNFMLDSGDHLHTGPVFQYIQSKHDIWVFDCLHLTYIDLCKSIVQYNTNATSR